MRTVKEVSSLTGVSIRTLHHYDAIGLLRPKREDGSKYRLYDDKDLERLQLILLFRELKFSLKEIGGIIDSPAFDKEKALEQQLELLMLQREHINNLISLARGIKRMGVKQMLDFSAFDTKKLDAYAKEAKEKWGNTDIYCESEEKTKRRSDTENKMLGVEMMDIFREFGEIRTQDAAGEQTQKLVRKLQDFITEHYYRCTPEILDSLALMYTEDVRFTENIDQAGGDGCAAFAAEAIHIYCKR
ncbi:MAG: MerR family transcriptional regulator [Marvinbryantia sp.]